MKSPSFGMTTAIAAWLDQTGASIAAGAFAGWALIASSRIPRIFSMPAGISSWVARMWTAIEYVRSTFVPVWVFFWYEVETFRFTVATVNSGGEWTFSSGAAPDLKISAGFR